MKRTTVPAVGLGVVLAVLCVGFENGQTSFPDAPAGFDGLANDPDPLKQNQFKQDSDIFAEQETIDDGLGPAYNAQSCGECHQSPVLGGISQVTELRAGRNNGNDDRNERNGGGVSMDHPGGSLINDRAVDALIQERVLDGYNVATLRTSLNTLGDGFVESIADSTIISIARE